MTQPPSTYFALANWELDTPIASGTGVVIIPGSTLTKGFTDTYFYSSPDNSMTFMCPVNGATTPNTHYPRTELRETPVDGDWPLLTGTHTLKATCKVSKFPAPLTPLKGIYIGQIHGDNDSHNPQLVKLLWTPTNEITVQIQEDADPSTEKTYSLGHVPALGQEIDYEIIITTGKLTVTVTPKSTNKSASMTATYKNKYWTEQTYYFKAGNYLQETDKSSTDYGVVQFYALTATHTK
ncbi:MAG: hypothetical protein Hyperionvirus14_37 [Hyperionvirus sp.]|uniref:Alginate lyase 2 domain-containing protein n=1 Tax=Hyperionvirus sp. TaxID=2487770 RepID=A0A3G5A9J9_9VIRU|nr:MAG: hypothetical protein Hyperionvirus14_37 [Hyperionvirus sp.]